MRPDALGAALGTRTIAQAGGTCVSQRVIPKAVTPKPRGLFETAMSVGQHLPGTLVHICNRKLKRRLCRRVDDTFSAVIADTGPGDLCVDLGANVGVISARFHATGADVISFEPDPVAFAELSARFARDDRITLVNKAASVEDTQMLLRRSTPADSAKAVAQSVESSIIRAGGRMDNENAVMVDVVDIVAFLTDLDRDIRILKMDIEGAEWDTLQRLMQAPVLQRIDCIFVETHERFEPARLIPIFNDLQARAVQMDRPYINLYWV